MLELIEVVDNFIKKADDGAVMLYSIIFSFISISGGGSPGFFVSGWSR